MRRALKILGVVVAVVVLISAGFIAVNWAPDRPVSELQQRWAPAPSMFVDIDGMRVHLRDEGPRDDPRPIVLIHGTSASLHTWQGWADALSRNHRVIRFDLPGFGLTGPASDEDYTVARYVRFVVAVLDAFGVKQAVIAGNSLGGEIAWSTAVAHPERVSALVIVDAAGYPFVPKSMPIGFKLAQMPALEPILGRVLPRSVIEESVRNTYGDPSKVTTELVDRYFELTLREGNRHALGMRFKQMGTEAVDSARIAGIRVPTLIIWGGKDQLIPPDNAERFRQDIEGSKLAVYPELGHVPQEEDPVATVAAVETFLAHQPQSVGAAAAP